MPNFIKSFGRRFLSENRVTMYLEDVIDSAYTWTFADKGKFCLRVRTQLNAFVPGSKNIYCCQELVSDAASWSQGDPECDAAVHRRDDGG